MAQAIKRKYSDILPECQDQKKQIEKNYVTLREYVRFSLTEKDQDYLKKYAHNLYQLYKKQAEMVRGESLEIEKMFSAPKKRRHHFLLDFFKGSILSRSEINQLGFDGCKELSNDFIQNIKTQSEVMSCLDPVHEYDTVSGQSYKSTNTYNVNYVGPNEKLACEKALIDYRLAKKKECQSKSKSKSYFKGCYEEVLKNEKDLDFTCSKIKHKFITQIKWEIVSGILAEPQISFVTEDVPFSKLTEDDIYANMLIDNLNEFIESRKSNPQNALYPMPALTKESVRDLLSGEPSAFVLSSMPDNCFKDYKNIFSGQRSQIPLPAPAAAAKSVPSEGRKK